MAIRRKMEEQVWHILRHAEKEQTDLFQSWGHGLRNVLQKRV
jgi:hypothetical protein